MLEGPGATSVGGGVTIVKTKLAEIHERLNTQFENVALKGHGTSSFVYAMKRAGSLKFLRTMTVSGSNFGRNARTRMLSPFERWTPRARKQPLRKRRGGCEIMKL